MLKKQDAAGHILAPVFFRRVVPHDNVQGRTDVTFMRQKLGVGSGDTVMLVDQAEAYSVPLISLMTRLLTRRTSRPIASRSRLTQTDFTSLANRAVAQKAKVVVLGSQVASNAQLFLQQLKSTGFTGAFFGTDGTFDSSKFTVPGCVHLVVRLDIHNVAVAKPFVAAFKKKYGKTISFGAPTFVAVQAIAMAISAACADGRVSRAEVRKEIGKVKMSNTLLGRPIAFDKFGDPIGGVGFSIFQIGSGGSLQRGSEGLAYL